MFQPRELEPLECTRLLKGGVVGRIAFTAPNGPHIVPVNYSIVDSAVIIRTSPYSLLGTHARDTQVAFEVDHFDYENHRGWSVVARGRLGMVTDPSELERIRSEWPPRPWAEGHRNLSLKVAWTELSGRQLGAGWSAESEMPVRRQLAGL